MLEMALPFLAHQAPCIWATRTVFDSPLNEEVEIGIFRPVVLAAIMAIVCRLIDQR